jgi:lipid-binding SYLF domain-containing protein
MSSSLVNLFFPLQAGGELTDFIIVLRTTEAVKTFSGNAHVSLGAGLSAAVGVVGRAVEADVRAGDGGYAACYTYSCSKGMFFYLRSSLPNMQLGLFF